MPRSRKGERASGRENAADTGGRNGIRGNGSTRNPKHNNQERNDKTMANEIFMRVEEVAKELGISNSYAYKIIRKMNEKLEKTGCIVMQGRIDRKFFHEQFYGTRTEKEV